jgi:hypothetical protein
MASHLAGVALHKPVWRPTEFLTMNGRASSILVAGAQGLVPRQHQLPFAARVKNQPGRQTSLARPTNRKATLCPTHQKLSHLVTS